MAVIKSFKINVVDHSPEVLAALETVMDKACEDAGMNAEKFAVNHINGYYDSKNTAVDTGRLKRSIGHKHEKDGDIWKVYVGTNVEYAYYVEMGTGDMGTGTGRKWTYYDKTRGIFRKTSGFRPRPFIRPALEQHKRFYSELFRMYLNGDD